MSGANRLINSDNTAKGGSEEELAAKLANANEEAADITETGMKYKSGEMPADEKNDTAEGGHEILPNM